MQTQRNHCIQRTAVKSYISWYWESLPNRYIVCACITGLQHSALYRFRRFAL